MRVAAARGHGTPAHPSAKFVSRAFGALHVQRVVLVPRTPRLAFFVYPARSANNCDHSTIPSASSQLVNLQGTAEAAYQR
jgi:hypothetical protein